MKVSTGDSVLEIQNPKSKIQNRNGSPPSEGGVAAASADGVVLYSHFFLNADLADQADLGGSESVPIFLLVVVSVFRVLRGPVFHPCFTVDSVSATFKAGPSKHTKHANYHEASARETREMKKRSPSFFACFAYSRANIRQNLRIV